MYRFWVNSLWLSSAMFFAGCSPNFDGTWLFQWDRSSAESTASDICPAEDERNFQGDEYEWIDIYTTTGGALVLTNGAQEWVGAVSGESFSVSATYGESDESYYYQWSEEIRGDLAGEDLSGRSDEYETTCDADEGCTGAEDECRRQTRRKFKAIKMEGTSGALRTIGTQAGQSASSPSEG